MKYMDGLINELLIQLEQNRALFGLLFIVAFLFSFLGWFIGRARYIRQIARLEVMLDYESKYQDDKSEERIQSMANSFAALSGEALRNNNQQFLDLANQTLQNFNLKAEHDLKLREQAVENIVAPLKDSLSRAEQQFQLFDRDRRRAHGELSAQLKHMSAGQHVLEQEARNLVKALSRPEVRGRWGEISLRRLVELAGMTAHCDFIEQQTNQTDEGIIRPDMIIQLPGKRQIVIDVKTPLDAYLNSANAANENERQKLLRQHASQVKDRVKELAAKKYWHQFPETPDFVILFILGEQFLGSALEADPELLDYALQLKIVLSTPTSLVALLRTIAYGWKQEQLNSHALEIRDLAQEYHHRLATFSEHLSSMGNHLHKFVGSYNQSIGSYRRSVMPIARKFADLGLQRNKAIAEPPLMDPTDITQRK
ncbi:MAG: DNA recombination protein RmuC [Gammaproteobacteria bacterium]|nr:DNA recombination protein RmuC [Gammaproteobacteria bacterium]